jgi:phenylalanyl-tRNA synthetase beta chain
MLIPLSWLKDYIDLDLPVEEVARALTMAGLEVDSIKLIGLPMPESADGLREFRMDGLPWSREHFVVAEILEVLPHPNADRLVLCRLNDGSGERIVLTGAPNLYEFKGAGVLPQPIKVAYAREGARLYDGHQPGWVLTTLKKTKIRGVDSDSMVCSEKELGISEEHEGIIILDADAPAGMALVDYMGDAVFEVSILPNMIRNACVRGMARELSAALGLPMKQPAAPQTTASGAPIQGQVSIDITDPALNPRFVLGLLRNTTPKQSPYWVQRRLRLAGMRPINSLVDATNYVMLELGEPLHAFDYDTLTQRAGGKAPTIITRAAKKGEKLTTLDGVERSLQPYTILVCDTAGPLSLAGVMGGQSSEVTDETRTVLLEGAAWNYINVRRTATSQQLHSEAGYRFSRGVHPALAPEAVGRCLAFMAAWSGGEIADGIVDAYPQPVIDPVIDLSTEDVHNLLGVEITADEIAALLSRLEFSCTVSGNTVRAQTPPHRLDIAEGLVGKADLLEEVARLYGYDRIPTSRLHQRMPRLLGDDSLEREEALKDILVEIGLTEVISYRLTSPEREARAMAPGAHEPADSDYVQIANPIAADRRVMRRSVRASLLEALEKNARQRNRLALFELGPVFLPEPGQPLPQEPQQLVIALTGRRQLDSWDVKSDAVMDFYDMKGVVEAMLEGLHIPDLRWTPEGNAHLHPGACATVWSGEICMGELGMLHPLVKERYDLGGDPVLLAECELAALLGQIPAQRTTAPVPTFPPILEDIAVVVDENVTAEQLETVICQAGGKLISDVRLFDIYRGEKLGAGKKSMAYSLTYQAPDRTLTDKDAAGIRQRIIRRLKEDLGAELRS